TDSNKRLNIGFDTTANVATLQSYTAAATVGNLLLNPSGGNVGIGSTTAPAAKLSIGNPIYGDATTLSSSFVTGAGTLGQTLGSELLLGNFGFATNNSQSLAISGYRTAAGATWADTALVLGMNVDVTKRSGAFLSLHSSGNIGIGNLTPAYKLDVNGTARVVGSLTAGGLSVGGAQVATASSSTAVAGIGGGDVATYFGSYTGTNSYATWLQALRPSDQLTFPMAINPNGGNVGIGTANPLYKLDVNGTARVSGQMNLGGSVVMEESQLIYGKSVAGTTQPVFWPRASNGTYLNYGTDGLYIRNNNSTQEMYFNGGRLAVGTLDTSQGGITTTTSGFTSLGTATNGVTSYVKMSYRADRAGIAFDVYNSGQYPNAWRGFSYDGDSNIDWYSDRTMKKDIVDAEPMLDRLMQLPFRRFHWKDVSDPAAKAEFGVIAQEVEPLFPDLVATGSDGMKTVGYTTFATIACKALQEYKIQTDADLSKLNEQIHERDTKIQALEAKLAEQEKRATAQADEVATQNSRLVALEKLMSKSGALETVSIKLEGQ
nr:tail fiber domain-containing protein [Akkermansiaceae bacterium]